jgi:hypothetical protein
MRNKGKITMFGKTKSIVLSSVLFVFCFAYNASATPINTSAEVVGNITVTEQTPLNFGQFTVGIAGGVINFDAGTVITTGGDVLLLGGDAGGVARLNTTGTPVAAPVTVTVTGTTLASGGNTMPIVGNCLGPNGGDTLGADNGSCTFNSNQSATDDVQIGGKLSVGASQPSGVYTGTLEVTAAF